MLSKESEENASTIHFKFIVVDFIVECCGPNWTRKCFRKKAKMMQPELDYEMMFFKEL